ncbi:MAG: Fe-S cluster assembly protein SufD, partial [Methylococcaceae bacterium]|nr:Fe-S cluster assembly protein SufD [Methylococcaceae bacterium]
MKSLTELATPFANVTAELGQNVAWLKSMRLKALVQFNNQGLPAKKHEDWKYTSLWAMSQLEFTHKPEESEVSAEQCDQLALLNDNYRVVIIDGVFSAERSTLDNLQDGLTINPLSAEQGLANAQPHLGQQIDIIKAGFNALNTLLMNEGIVITVDSDVQIEKTIEVLVINTGTTAQLATHLRNVIVMADNSQATVIEHYVGLTD